MPSALRHVAWSLIGVWVVLAPVLAVKHILGWEPTEDALGAIAYLAGLLSFAGTLASVFWEIENG